MDRPRSAAAPHPPALLPRLRRRPRLDGPGVAAAARRPARGRPPQPPTRCAPQPPHFAAEGEERHLPVHGRRPEPARAVRPQARSSQELRRPADPRLVHQGQAVRLHGHLHQGARRSSSARSRKFASTASAAPGSRSACRTSATIADDIAVRPHRWRPTSSTTARPSCFVNTGIAAVRPAEHGLVGHLRPRQRVATDLPGFVVLQSGPRGPRGGAATVGSGFLPTAYQGVPFLHRRRARSST